MEELNEKHYQSRMAFFEALQKIEQSISDKKRYIDRLTEKRDLFSQVIKDREDWREKQDQHPDYAVFDYDINDYSKNRFREINDFAIKMAHGEWNADCVLEDFVLGISQRIEDEQQSLTQLKKDFIEK